MDQKTVLHPLAQRAHLGQLHAQAMACQYPGYLVEQACTVGRRDVEHPALCFFVWAQADLGRNREGLHPPREHFSPGFMQGCV